MSQICGTYDEEQKCYTDDQKDIWDILIYIIVRILEEILEPDISYMKCDYNSGQLTVYIGQPPAPKILTQTQLDNVLEDCKELLEEMDFTLSIPLPDFEITYQE